MIVIARPANGITLNGLEYILDENGEIMKFENCNRASAYLIKTEGYTWEQIENEGIRFIYTNERGKCDCCQCEREDCYVRDDFRRHPFETTRGMGVGLCPKLLEKEWTEQWTRNN